MKFLHLADLHLGKSIYGVSMLDSGDQIVWVERFLEKVQQIQPDAVVIAGDVYDRSSPAGDAVALLDKMITALAEMGISVLIVAGNHDSGQRLSFGGSLLAKQNIHIAGVLAGEIPHVTLSDQYGPVTFWLMPYIFPALIAQKLGDSTIRDYDVAIQKLLAEQAIDFTQRNVLIAHQNVTANGQENTRGGSESMVGGVGQIDYQIFDGFDYVALGHIHAAYPIGRETVRYAGSPMCYHFSETKQPIKGPILVELGAKDTPPTIQVQTIPPLHPMRELKGTYSALQAEALQSSTHDEYIRIVLTDRRPTPEIYSFFRSLFDKRGSILMEMTSEYEQFSPVSSAILTQTSAEKAIEELFKDFYTSRCGDMPDEPTQALLDFIGEQVRHTDRSDDKTVMEKQIQDILKFAAGQEDAQ